MIEAQQRTDSQPASANDERDALPYVNGVIGFVKRPGDAPTPQDYTLPDYSGATLVPAHLKIHNARPIAGSLSLHREGFELIDHPTAYAAERDPEVMRSKYLDEMVPFIKNYFGASRVVPRRQGMYVRSAVPTGINGVRSPAGYSHMDFARSSAPELAATEDKLQGIDTLPYSRMMIIQAWRALSTPPQDMPLALCDGRTMVDSDTYDKEAAVGPKGVIGNTFRSRATHYNVNQRWYYFPEMTSNELILFKGFDSDTSTQPNVGHSAFDGRAAYPNALPRESVEARFFVYFD